MLWSPSLQDRPAWASLEALDLREGDPASAPRGRGRGRALASPAQGLPGSVLCRAGVLASVDGGGIVRGWALPFAGLAGSRKHGAASEPRACPGVSAPGPRPWSLLCFQLKFREHSSFTSTGTTLGPPGSGGKEKTQGTPGAPEAQDWMGNEWSGARGLYRAQATPSPPALPSPLTGTVTHVAASVKAVAGRRLCQRPGASGQSTDGP